MSFMPVTESMFLVAETREHPMHVGSLQLFDPPGDSHVFAQEIHRKFTENPDVAKLFRKSPGRPLATMGNITWAEDNDIDFEYHVRRTVLPTPGRIRELFQFVSLNHSTLLDRHRPMWEVHIIEGLADGRIALYIKVHHSLVDGVSALMLTLGTLTTDPDDRTGTAMWDPSKAKVRKALPTRSTLQALTGTVGSGAHLARELASIAPAAAKIGIRALRERNVVLPMRAPHTILNVPIGGARRFAAQSWSIARIRETAKLHEVTLNDMVLAMCAGALRSYLIDLEALPNEPLIAMVPVSLRKKGDNSAGNQVSTILANLGTDQADPLDRLYAVTESTKQGKSMMRELNPVQALAYGAAIMAPLLFATIPGVVRATPPPFNVIISNVPGIPEELYWNGARLDGIYPASIVCDGQALNITVASNGDSMNFGLIGCRRSVPHLQRILTHLENALVELEKAR